MDPYSSRLLRKALETFLCTNMFYSIWHSKAHCYLCPLLQTCRWCLCRAGTWERRWSLLCRNVLWALQTSWTSGCGTLDRHRSQTPSQRRDGPAKRKHIYTCAHKPCAPHRGSRVIILSRNPWPRTCWDCFKGDTCLLLINFTCLFNGFLCN